MGDYSLLLGRSEANSSVQYSRILIKYIVYHITTTLYQAGIQLPLGAFFTTTSQLLYHNFICIPQLHWNTAKNV